MDTSTKRWAISLEAPNPLEDNKQNYILRAVYKMAGETMLDLGCRSAPCTRDFKGEWLDLGRTICDASVIFTPLGELWMTDDPGPHSHKSGWWPQEFFDMGWAVWEWPNMHKLSDGGYHGAFWAWKFHTKTTPTPLEVSQLSEVGINSFND